MAEILHREFVYIWYYFDVQFRQIAFYWIVGMISGSAISVFAKQAIHGWFANLQGKKLGLFGIIPACLLGIASPLCMYGTIPLSASFHRQGMRDDWLAAFMMASILLNPQLIMYSVALGPTALAVRILSSILCGCAAGLLVAMFFSKKPFFNFDGFGEPSNHDTDPNILMRFLKNLGRNIRATAGYFLFGVLLSALFQRYVPSSVVSGMFGKNNEGFGVLMAATVGVPLYACGGGTIPLLLEWLEDGMSMGSAAAFMITGPATKITNLGALKIVLGIRNFVIYLAFVMIFSFITGWFVNFVV